MSPRDLFSHLCRYACRRGHPETARRIVHHIAMDLLLTGSWMEVSEAQQRGLVNEIHPGGESAFLNQQLGV